MSGDSAGLDMVSVVMKRADARAVHRALVRAFEPRLADLFPPPTFRDKIADVLRNELDDPVETEIPMVADALVTAILVEINDYPSPEAVHHDIIHRPGLLNHLGAP